MPLLLHPHATSPPIWNCMDPFLFGRVQILKHAYKSHLIDACADADAHEVLETIQIWSIGNFLEKKSCGSPSLNWELNWTKQESTSSLPFSSVCSLAKIAENQTEWEWTGSLLFSSVQFSVRTGWTKFFFSMYSKFPIYQIWIVSSISWAWASAHASIKWDL